MSGVVLIVDDEIYVRDSLALVFEQRGFTVRLADGAMQALEGDRLQGVDVAVLDLKMPDGDGIDVLRALHESEPGLPVIILTGHGSVATAVECLKAGATEFVQKPADPNGLVLLVERAMSESARKRELDYLRSEGGTSPSKTEAADPIGTSPAWKDVVALAKSVARSDASILILGESGSGKEEVARLIHRSSTRASHAFVRVNCASVPTDLFESEFFGHRKGSFTGATADREGRFRVADRGTLFLDEIGSMPGDSQAKVLRVLQDGVFERIGESQSTSVDVRIVAATNANLETEIRSGSFREDLYYRIAVVVIQVPPLRERPEDVEELTRYFLDHHAHRLGRPRMELDPDVARTFGTYRWPGNVRELKNVIERATILATGDTVGIDVLPPNMRLPEESASLPLSGDEEGLDAATRVRALESLALRDVLLRTEREVIEEALRRSEGVRREAARLLGIDERNLSYFLRKHQIAKRREERGT